MKSFVLVLLFMGTVSKVGFAKNRPYQEVLKELYPKCELQKKVYYLTKDQVRMIETKTKERINSKIRISYFDSCSEDTIYVDSHIVRTLNETVLFSVNKGRVKNIEIASFNEPPEYIAPKKWIDQLVLKNKVDSLSGATLSENALKRSLNEIKILHEVVTK